MLLTDIVNQINAKVMGDKRSSDDLSPVSALRLNFDDLKTETTDPEPEPKNVFGVPVRQLVPQRVISWIENSSASPDSEVEVISIASTSSASNNNEQPCISRKV